MSEIEKKRIEQLTGKVINKCKTLNVSKLNITTLGDCIQGMLRISDVKINDVPVVECVVEVSRLIAQMLNEISKVTYITYYHTMASNHSQTRPLNSKQLLAEEDLEVNHPDVDHSLDSYRHSPWGKRSCPLKQAGETPLVFYFMLLNIYFTLEISKEMPIFAVDNDHYRVNF